MPFKTGQPTHTTYHYWLTSLNRMPQSDIALAAIIQVLNASTCYNTYSTLSLEMYVSCSCCHSLENASCLAMSYYSTFESRTYISKSKPQTTLKLSHKHDRQGAKILKGEVSNEGSQTFFMTVTLRVDSQNLMGYIKWRSSI